MSEYLDQIESLEAEAGDERAHLEHLQGTKRTRAKTMGGRPKCTLQSLESLRILRSAGARKTAAPKRCPKVRRRTTFAITASGMFLNGPRTTSGSWKLRRVAEARPWRARRCTG